jgi:hypothetical protein
MHKEVRCFLVREDDQIDDEGLVVSWIRKASYLSSAACSLLRLGYVDVEYLTDKA